MKVKVKTNLSDFEIMALSVCRKYPQYKLDDVFDLSFNQINKLGEFLEYEDQRSNPEDTRIKKPFGSLAELNKV